MSYFFRRPTLASYPEPPGSLAPLEKGPGWFEAVYDLSTGGALASGAARFDNATFYGLIVRRGESNPGAVLDVEIGSEPLKSLVPGTEIRGRFSSLRFFRSQYSATAGTVRVVLLTRPDVDFREPEEFAGLPASPSQARIIVADSILDGNFAPLAIESGPPVQALNLETPGEFEVGETIVGASSGASAQVIGVANGDGQDPPQILFLGAVANGPFSGDEDVTGDITSEVGHTRDEAAPQFDLDPDEHDELFASIGYVGSLSQTRLIVPWFKNIAHWRELRLALDLSGGLKSADLKIYRWSPAVPAWSAVPQLSQSILDTVPSGHPYRDVLVTLPASLDAHWIWFDIQNPDPTNPRSMGIKVIGIR